MQQPFWRRRLEARGAGNDLSDLEIKPCQASANQSHLHYEILTETGPLSKNPPWRGFASFVRLRCFGGNKAAHAGNECGCGWNKAGQARLKSSQARIEAASSSPKAGYSRNKAGGPYGTEAAQLPA
jgi:hypothetical protein